MFFCHVVSTIVAGTVQLGVQAWTRMFSNIDGLSADQKDGFICPYTTVSGTASIIVSSLSYCAKFGFCCSTSPVVLQRGVIGPQSLSSHSSTTALYSSSLSASLHRCSSGHCTTSSKSVSSSTSTSRSSSSPQTTYLPRPLTTACPGCFSALSLAISSVGATSVGGPETTVRRLMRPDGFFSDVRFASAFEVGYYRCVVRWIGYKLCSRSPYRLLDTETYRKMARLAWTAFRNGGVILFT
jgi:hypothetical protein